MKNILIVGLGGFLGSIARYGVFLISSKYISEKSYPGTLIVNLAGCLLIGLLAGGILKNHQQLALFLVVGFCGAFTTFSTFGMDGLKLLRDGLNAELIFYTVGSVVGGMILCFGGIHISQRL